MYYMEDDNSTQPTDAQIAAKTNECRNAEPSKILYRIVTLNSQKQIGLSLCTKN